MQEIWIYYKLPFRLELYISLTVNTVREIGRFSSRRHPDDVSTIRIRPEWQKKLSKYGLQNSEWIMI